MALSAIIGALRVIIGADAAELETGLKKANSSIDKFAANAKTAASIMAASMLAASTLVLAAVRKTINDADEIGKKAQAWGVTTEELSKLKYAAELSDVSFENLGKSIIIFSRKMGEAATDIQGESAYAFKALGISVVDAQGKLKSSTQLMAEVADKFAVMKDGAGKTRLAVELFGRSGADMIPMLNQGAAALNEAYKEAEEFGLVLDNRTTAAAELFNDNLTRLGSIMQGIFRRVTAEMLPAFVQFSKALLDVARDGNTMKMVAENIVAFLRGMVAVVLTVVVAIKRLGAELSATWEMLKLFSKGEFSKGVEVFKNAGKETQEAFAKLNEVIAKFYQDAEVTIDESAPTIKKKMTAPFIDSKNSIQNQFAKMLEGTRKSIAQLNAEAQTFGMTPGSAAAFRKEMELTAVAVEKFKTVTPAMAAEIRKIATEYGNATLQAEGFRLKMEMRTPMQVMRDDLARLHEMVRAGAIDWQTYGDAVMRTRARAAQSMLGMASEAAGLFGQIFKDSKAAAIAQAVISAAEGVARSLGAYPWPFAGIMAALHAAAGAAQVNRIRSISKSSSAAPAAPAAATAPAMNEQTLTLRGLDKPWTSRDSVMELIEAINKTQKDGTRVRLVT